MMKEMAEGDYFWKSYHFKVYLIFLFSAL